MIPWDEFLTLVAQILILAFVVAILAALAAGVVTAFRGSMRDNEAKKKDKDDDEVR